MVDGRQQTVKVHPRFISNSFPALRKAAMSGLGIAMLPQRIVVGEIDSGVLVQVLDKVSLERTPLFAAYTPDGAIPLKVRTLLDFLSVWFKSHVLAAPA